MWVCTGRFVSFRRAPRPCISSLEQLGANRGVIMGVMRVCVGSILARWDIVARVSASAVAGDSSR